MSQPGGRFRGSFHYAWVVVAVTFLAILAGAGIRAAPTVLIVPLEREFGWSRAAIAAAVGVNLLLYGVAAPIAGHLIDRAGPRRVMLGSLALLTGGVAASVAMRSLWQLSVLWGGVVGFSAGGVASVLTAAVAHRWFVRGRGVALGVLNTAASMGQLVFLPLLMAITVAAGWRAGVLVMAAAALAVLVLVLFWMRDDPADVGARPYGASEGAEGLTPGGEVPASNASPGESFRVAAMLGHPTFWLLAGSFFVCGATSMGLIGTHLIPYAMERGIGEAGAAATVGVMGGTNFVGTLLAGWLTDRFDARKILAWVFVLRGFSLLMLPFIRDASGLILFGLVFGVDWFATVPPVVTIAADAFGQRSVGTVYGWVFLAHQVGASLAAVGAGETRVELGDYRLAFLAGAAMALMAAVLPWGIPRRTAQMIPSARPGGG